MTLRLATCAAVAAALAVGVPAVIALAGALELATRVRRAAVTAGAGR